MKTNKTINTRRNPEIESTIESLLLLSIVLSIFVFSFGDAITTPLNNSNLQINQIYNISIDITAISSTITSDTANLLVNGSLVYAGTYTANGLYRVPLIFYNYGTYNLTLKTTTGTFESVLYNLNAPIINANIYLYYLNYFSFVIILMVIGYVLSYILRHYSFFSNFVMAIASLLSLFYVWANPITQYINSYYVFWLSLTAFLLLSIYYLIRIGFSLRD